jgi:polyketide cyclase/dehydrase/lipid transport protein
MAEIRYEESILIAAEPERVFDYRIDFTTLPQYNPNVSNLRRVDAGTGHEAGAEYVFNLQMAGAPEPIESPLRLTTVERPTSFSYDTGPGFMAEGLCTFEAKEGGTLVTLGYTLRFPGEVDDAAAEQMAAMGREDSRMELQNMKKILEG